MIRTITTQMDKIVQPGSLLRRPQDSNRWKNTANCGHGLSARHVHLQAEIVRPTAGAGARGRFGLADFSVIADVSLTLQTVLTQAFQPLDPVSPPIAEISDLSGSIATSPARLTIFLFETVEDASARNRPRVVRTTPPDLSRSKPPMALLLRYMMTAWSGDRVTDHRILGRTLQVLYDGDTILSGLQLQGTLAGTDEALKVTLAPITLEERARVWYAIQKPYRLSLTYEVRVVNLDPLAAEHILPVAERDLKYLGPEARV